MIKPIELNFKADKDSKLSLDTYCEVNESEAVINLAVYFYGKEL